MSQTTAINYIDTNFEFKELTKIHGEPTFETIKILHNQLKANASSVPSGLGGGNFGHLGLVLTPAQYALISPVPFDRPAHPGTLVIQNGTPQHAAQTRKDIHKEQLRVFNEVLGVEANLRQQIVSAVDEQYLIAIRNRQTNAITEPVHGIIMDHLYAIYGDIDPQKLQEEEEKVKQLVYDVSLPPDTVYMAIEDLMDMGEASNAPFTQRQAVNMAYNIISRTGRFTENIREWLRRPIIQQTWINFKRHFSAAHKELKKLGALQLHDTMQYQQANIISQMVLAAMQEQLQPPTQEESPPPEPLVHQANAATQDALIPLLMQQLQQQTQAMQEMMKTMQLNQGNNNSNNSGAAPNRPNKKFKYCWTHGYCFHEGKECTRKAQGHKDNATVTNRMGGSNRGCNKHQG